MGHLMCASCFTHLLADSRLRDQVATCPNCRVEISKNNASRNLAVEKAVSELPSECQVKLFCFHYLIFVTFLAAFLPNSADLSSFNSSLVQKNHSLPQQKRKKKSGDVREK
jgi:predicted RNA-binding Zn-ribbon protein involved in translation (DUF1610 family)